MNFVINIGIEAAEPVFPLVVRNIGLDVLGMRILQVNDGGLDRGFLLVHHAAVHGAQLGLAAFFLRQHTPCGKGQENENDKFPACLHGFPPATGSIRTVNSSWFPSRALMWRVCAWNPRASIVTSYSAPCLTRMPSSPRRSETASQRNFFSSARRTRTLAPGNAKPWPSNMVAKMRKSSAWECVCFWPAAWP